VDRDLPQRRDRGGRLGASGGGFYRAGSEEEAAYRSELRLRFGDEVAGLVERSATVGGRQLTETERDVLETTAAPVLADMVATGALLPDLRPEAPDDRGDLAVCAWVRGSDGSGTGLSIWLANSVPERIARLADQLQEWEVEELAAAGRPATWPECPEHPGSHPLDPAVDDTRTAVWRCPRSGRVVGPIGELPESA
jgi:hypothetical protein